jgi:hypothetical protein
MAHFQDLTGQDFDRLHVLSIHPDRSRGIRWLCQCRCGNQTTVMTSALKGRHTRSCGCLWKDSVPAHNRSHGRTGTYLYRAWTQIIQRCHNPNNPAYRYYGARGIAVCASWRASFVAFAHDVGERPSESHTLERRDNNGPYSPENTYWATRTDQARNRRSSRLLTHNGLTKTMAEWEEITGISSVNIRQRLDRYGYTVERALTESPYHGTLLTFCGETKTMTVWAQELGLSVATIQQRLQRLGWSVEKALSFPKRQLQKARS